MPDLHRFFLGITRHRAGVLAAYAVLLALAGLGISRLRIDYSAEQFFIFPGDERATFDAYKESFPREDLQVSAFLALEGPLTVGDFRRLEGVADAFTEAGLSSVRWLGNAEFLEETLIGDETASEFVRLVEEPDLTDERVSQVLRRHADDPLWAGVLWSADQRVVAVHGFLEPDENNDAHRRELHGFLASRLDELAPERGRLILNGLPMLRVTVPLALSTDLARMLGLGILAAVALVALYFHRAGLALLSLAGIVPAIALTMGGMGLVGRPVSVLTSSTPIVVLVVGISDAIHLLVGSRRRSLAGAPRRDAVAGAFASLARACFFTSLTTAVGFLGLLGTRIPVVAEFGVTTAVAVMTTWLVSMTLLPALLTYAPDFGADTTLLSRWCHGVARAARGTLRLRPRFVLPAFAVVMGAAAAFAAGLEVRAFLIDDLKEGDPILEELRWLEDSGFGVFQVNVFVEHGDVPGHDPESLRWTEEIQTFAEADGMVLGALSLPEMVRQMGAAAGLEAHPEGPFGEAAGDDRWSRRTVDELLFLAEIQGDDSVDEVYREEAGVSQVILFVRDAGSGPTTVFLDRLEARLRREPPPGGTAAATGTVKLSQIFWRELIARFLPGVALSVALVWLSLVWLFRSFRLGLLALLPNLFPLTVLAGVLAVGGFDLKPSTAIVFSMAFGIIVDDTIHILAALAGPGGRTGDLREGLDRVFREAGPALVLSTVVVVVGFGVLMASRFEALFLMGLLTGLGALLALVADLLGLPHLFIAAGAARRTDPSGARHDH
ncbi:MAG TPA: MMPL family transporter [Longimicrobiales bacterium]|nr:MMPL family transporter [Longimicrobiales bacterium]